MKDHLIYLFVGIVSVLFCLLCFYLHTKINFFESLFQFIVIILALWTIGFVIVNTYRKEFKR